MPKLALVGYGKMGKMLDQLSSECGFETVLRLDERLRVTTAPALYGDLKALLGPACLG